MKRLEATEENLAAAVERWQGILRLRDWQVKARFGHHTEFPDGSVATVEQFEDCKEADIVIGWPHEYPEDWTLTRDWEHSVLHELLELHLKRFKPKEGNPALKDAEIAINLIASALLALDRREGSDIIEVTERMAGL